MKPARLAPRLRLTLTLVMTAGCCTEPWRAFPEKTAPDRSCSTGSVHGHDVYIWDCLRGQHVVVAQYSAEMSCQAATREVAPCGALTALETSLALTPAACSGARAGRDWR
jgi:hypothetical protein